MENTPNQPNDTKAVFKKCGTCAQTFAHILNREFGHPRDAHERAVDPLAGGILRHGHQCGMLWGATLAVGAESYQRFEDTDQAKALALIATQHVVDSFLNQTNTVNCRAITGVNMRSFFGMVKFMLQTMIKGMENSLCFNLAEEWAPKAIQAGKEGFADIPVDLPEKPMNCASEVARRMGATDEETVMVAGFAGGLGLSGKGCGALAAAIWMKALEWCKTHPGENPPFFKNPEAEKLIKAFNEVTRSEMECQKITGRNFDTIEEHSDFIKKGGCAELIDILTKEGNTAS